MIVSFAARAIEGALDLKIARPTGERDEPEPEFPLGHVTPVAPALEVVLTESLMRDREPHGGNG